jgi:hypothetical protein
MRYGGFLLCVLGVLEGLGAAYAFYISETHSANEVSKTSAKLLISIGLVALGRYLFGRGSKP